MSRKYKQYETITLGTVVCTICHCYVKVVTDADKREFGLVPYIEPHIAREHCVSSGSPLPMVVHMKYAEEYGQLEIDRIEYNS